MMTGVEEIVGYIGSRYWNVSVQIQLSILFQVDLQTLFSKISHLYIRPLLQNKDTHVFRGRAVVAMHEELQMKWVVHRVTSCR